MIIQLINTIYQFLWGDLIRIPLPGGSSLGISLLILLLIPTGIFFTIRTHFLPIRLFPDMLKALTGEKEHQKQSFLLPGSYSLYRHKSGHGQSGGCRGC